MTNIKEIKKDFYNFMDEKCEGAVGDLVSDEIYDRVRDDLIVRLIKNVMEDYPNEFTTEKHDKKTKPQKRKKSLNQRVTTYSSGRSCGYSIGVCGHSVGTCG